MSDDIDKLTDRARATRAVAPAAREAAEAKVREIECEIVNLSPVYRRLYIDWSTGRIAAFTDNVIEFRRSKP